MTSSCYWIQVVPKGDEAGGFIAGEGSRRRTQKLHKESDGECFSS
jgi:hypothetical protein